MNRSRITGDLVSQNNIFVDIANDRVGIGTTQPTHKVDLAGSFKLHDGSGYGNHITFTQNPPTITFPTGPVANLSKTPTLVFGDRTSGGDFKIYQDHYSLHMRHLGPSGFHIGSQASHLQISGSNGSNAVQPAIRIDPGATEGVKLYSGGTQRFETVGYGITVLGTTETQELNVTGVTTMSGDLTISNTAPSIFLTDTNHDSDFRILNQNGTFKIYDQTNGADRLEIFSGGTVAIDGNLDANAGIDVTGNSTFANNVDVTGTLTVGQLNNPTQILGGNPTFRLRTLGNSLANAGFLEFYYNTSNLSARIRGKARNSANGQIFLDVEKSSTMTNILLVDDAGVDITGNITGTGNLTLTSTDAGSSAAPEIDLFRNSASPADADYLGQIKFQGESDTGVQRNYAKITGKILDASNGTEDGIIEFAHIKAGSQTITGRWRSDSLQLLNDTNLTVDGNITVNNLISLNSDDSSPARIDLYCESGNAHYTRLQAPAHSTYSGNVTVTIPNASGNLAVLANAANNRVVTATATHAMTGESNLTFDGSRLDVLGNTDGNVQAVFTRGNDANFQLQFRNESSSNNANTVAGKFGLFYDSSSTDICGMQFLRGTSTLAGSLNFTTGGTTRLRINSDGHTDVIGNLDVTSGLDVTGNITVSGTVDGVDIAAFKTSFDNLSTDIVNDSSPQLGADLDVNGNTIKSGHQIYEIVLNQRHNFKSAGNTIMNINGNGVDFQHGNNTHADNVKSQFGASNDLQIYHDGSHSRIVDSGTGNLILQTSKLNVNNAANNEALIHASENGAVELYHDNTLRYVSYSGGVKISTDASQGRLVLADTSGNFAYQLTGTDPTASGESGGRLVVQDANGGMVVDSRTAGGNMFLYNNIVLNGNATADSLKLIMGAGQDFQLYHDGTNSRIHNTATGAIIIKNEAQDGDFMIQANDGGTNQNLLHFDTSETGLASFHGEINMRGTNRIRFYHNTGNGTFQSFIGQQFINNNFNLVIDNQQNNIFYQSDRHVFRDKSGEGGEVFAEFIKDAGLELYFNGNKKLETTNIGCKITGGHGDGLQIENGGTNLSTQIKLKNTTVNKEYTLGVAGNTGNNGQNSSFVFRDETANTTRLEINSSGHLIPGQGSTYDLGATGRAWNNLYVNDMHFSNEGSSNSVDGTWGDWTLQEGENDVFMINNRTGKKFAITMREVS